VSKIKRKKHTMNNVPNLRIFEVKYLAPTNHKGSRVSISEPRNQGTSHTKRVTLSYDYATGDILTQAVQHLQSIGMNVTGKGDAGDKYIVTCDNFGEDFQELRK
tara:strand:+ start:444 stop:755 length:312 start_codon:yes stop_codon:yes gene_type:complete